MKTRTHQEVFSGPSRWTEANVYLVANYPAGWRMTSLVDQPNQQELYLEMGWTGEGQRMPDETRLMEQVPASANGDGDGAIQDWGRWVEKEIATLRRAVDLLEKRMRLMNRKQPDIHTGEIVYDSGHASPPPRTQEGL